MDPGLRGQQESRRERGREDRGMRQVLLHKPSIEGGREQRHDERHTRGTVTEKLQQRQTVTACDHDFSMEPEAEFPADEHLGPAECFGQLNGGPCP